MTEYKFNRITGALSKDALISTKMHPKGIRLITHLPENISENARRQKINRIYDILAPGKS